MPAVTNSAGTGHRHNSLTLSGQQHAERAARMDTRHRRTRHRLALFLRSLASVFLIGLTSFALVATSAPTAQAAMWDAPDGAPRTVGKTALKAGTRAAPLRFLTCGSIPGLIGCTAAAGGLYWLTETDGGRELRENWDDWGYWTGNPQSSRQCTWTVSPAQWGQHSIALEVSLSGYVTGMDRSCSSADQIRAIGAPQIHAQCIRADGQMYTTTDRIVFDSGNVFNLCNTRSDDWLMAAHINQVVHSYSSLANPGYYPNPLWNGAPGGDLDFWDDVSDAETRVTLRCRDSNGTVTDIETTFDGSQTDPAASCPPDSTAVGRLVELLRMNGSIVRQMYDVGVDPDAMDEFNACFAGGSYCQMSVRIDGQVCEYGMPGCADWWGLAQVQPHRVDCQWGPYTMHYSDCSQLRNAYVSEDGAWVPKDTDPGSIPIPFYPTDPDYRPLPPVGGGDPAWLDPAICPPVPAGNRSSGVTEYGLEPIALAGVRCFIRDHPDFIFTSGMRSWGSVPNSDHPHGLAVDVAPPAWDTPAGRQRGWDAVAYWIHNARELGVRYVIFAEAIWTPTTGWHVYEGPNPHDDHVHISFDPTAKPGGGVGTAPNPDPRPPGAPEPIPNPNPLPDPPVNPRPDPNPTDPDPHPPVIPEEGTNPEDPDGCLARTWTWDPSSWVLAPIKCGLTWAFKPSDPAITQVQTQIQTAVNDTGIPTWTTTIADIPTSMTVGQTPTAGCMGPPMNLPEPFPTIYLFEACDGFRATMATYTNVFMTAGLVVGTLLTSTSLISRGFGYDASTGSGKA